MHQNSSTKSHQPGWSAPLWPAGLRKRVKKKLTSWSGCPDYGVGVEGENPEGWDTTAKIIATPQAPDVGD